MPLPLFTLFHWTPTTCWTGWGSTVTWDNSLWPRESTASHPHGIPKGPVWRPAANLYLSSCPQVQASSPPVTRGDGQSHIQHQPLKPISPGWGSWYSPFECCKHFCKYLKYRGFLSLWGQMSTHWSMTSHCLHQERTPALPSVPSSKPWRHCQLMVMITNSILAPATC